MKNDYFTSYVCNAPGCSTTTQGMYVRFDRVREAQLRQLIAIALECSEHVLLCGPEDPDGDMATSLCVKVSSCSWKLKSQTCNATAISNWAYYGNWCLFMDPEVLTSPIPFEFRELEQEIDRVFESLGSSKGLIAFHDNTTIWAYAKKRILTDQSHNEKNQV